MLKKIRKASQVVFALLLLIGLVVMVTFLVTRGLHMLLQLPKELAVALIATTVAPIGSVGTIVIGKYFERRSSRDQDIRIKKIATYEAFLTALFAMIFDNSGKKDSDGNLTNEFKDSLREVQKLLVIWGSDEVVRRWSRLRRNMTQVDPQRILMELDELMKAIRSDIGHTNRLLVNGDVVGMIVNDMPLSDGHQTPEGLPQGRPPSGTVSKKHVT